MDARLARLEQSLDELKAENRQLRGELEELRGRVCQPEPESEADKAEQESQSRSRQRGRWTAALILLAGLIAVPTLVLTIWHPNAFWSTVVTSVNALLVYFIGPGAVRLLVEGLLRAIPGVVLGQTARITVDNMRRKRAR